MKENFDDRKGGCKGAWPEDETALCTGAVLLD